MDANLKRVGRQALQQQCEIGAVAMPEPVRHPPGLQRHISLEIEQRRQKPRGSRIVKNNSFEIAARGIDKAGRGRKGLAGDTRKQTSIAGAFAEALSNLPGHRSAEIGMIEDRRR